MVEVPPAELTVERLLAARQAVLDLARRDAAEVKVGERRELSCRPSASRLRPYSATDPSRKRSSARLACVSPPGAGSVLLGEAERFE